MPALKQAPYVAGCLVLLSLEPNLLLCVVKVYTT